MSVPSQFLVPRMQPFSSTIFSEITNLARKHDAINLGQGFPDTNPPAEVARAAIRAIERGDNQYPPGRGTAILREAVAAHQAHWYGIDLDPEREVIASAGATEALSAAVLALCHAGDEVIAFEPWYDAYAADIALAGGTLVPVRLEPPSFALPLERLRTAITERTRLLILNSPHNPTGHVFTKEELHEIAALAIAHDLIVIADEVYEHLCFDGRRHVPIASLPGMFDRTITISSGGKTFSTTGWKIGWASGPAELLDAVHTVKQWLSFANGTPFQHGIAAGLVLPDVWFEEQACALQRRRDQLVPALETAGMTVFPSESTYFVIADLAPLGETDALRFCRELPARIGVAGIPVQAFAVNPAGMETLVRFAFCKQPELLGQSARRLATLSDPGRE